MRINTYSVRWKEDFTRTLLTVWVVTVLTDAVLKVLVSLLSLMLCWLQTLQGSGGVLALLGFVNGSSYTHVARTQAVFSRGRIQENIIHLINQRVQDLKSHDDLCVSVQCFGFCYKKMKPYKPQHPYLCAVGLANRYQDWHTTLFCNTWFLWHACS